MLEKSKKFSPLEDIKHKYCVKIPFSSVFGAISDWNEQCAMAIQMFGLPGDRFVCCVTPSHVEFLFRDEKDAIFFELVCG